MKVLSKKTIWKQKGLSLQPQTYLLRNKSIFMVIFSTKLDFTSNE